jgi:hypothetical protein
MKKTRAQLKCRNCLRADALEIGKRCRKHSIPHRAHPTRPKGIFHDRKPVSAPQYRLWQSMRVLRRFTLSQLAATSETSYGNAKKYALGLMHHDYIRIVAAAHPERGRNGEAVRVLTRDTGPKAPRVRADKSLFDPNVVASGGGDGSKGGVG